MAPENTYMLFWVVLYTLPDKVWEYLNPFTPHKWPRQNFSLQYQYNVKQAGDKNREEYQLWDY